LQSVKITTTEVIYCLHLKVKCVSSTLLEAQNSLIPPCSCSFTLNSLNRQKMAWWITRTKRVANVLKSSKSYKVYSLESQRENILTVKNVIC